MANETLARRYSAALFALAKEAGTSDQTVAEIDAFVAALGTDETIAQFFDSPVIDRTLKIELLDRSLAGRFGELSRNFLLLLVRKRRENLIATVGRQLHEMLDQDAGRSVARIATPTPLAPHEVAELARKLSDVYKRPLVPQATDDPSLLGGVVVQVGDRYVDASVAGKLEEIRRHLLAGVEMPGTTSPNGKGT